MGIFKILLEKRQAKEIETLKQENSSLMSEFMNFKEQFNNVVFIIFISFDGSKINR